MENPGKYVRSLPRKPGVYLFRDVKGTVIYVGKASSLRNRVASYFSSRVLSPKAQKMISRIEDIDFIVTDSGREALILESNLIKKHRPLYNVRLKDDKSYPYLKVTLSEEWPRVVLTRRLKDDGSRYFGPYADAGSSRQLTNFMNRVFPYRTCKKKLTGKETRPCLKYHIGRCSGPCIGAITSEDYLMLIERVVLFLGGKQDQVIRELKKKMSQASSGLDFEKAALLRDQIQSLERLAGQQTVVSASRTSEDVIAIDRDRDTSCAQVFFVRGGKLIGQEHFLLDGTQDETPGHILAVFLEQFYAVRTDVPPRILLQVEPDDRELISEWLQSRSGHRVRLVVPQRGEGKRLVRMVSVNAAEMLEQWRLKWLADTGKTGAALEELRSGLDLPGIPKRIECYDISDIRGTAAVGSMTVFEEGKPRPSHYRRFRIKSVLGIDDYAMMQEVLRRRFARTAEVKSRRSGGGWTIFPDLILIDGGRGHLNAIVQVMRDLGVESVPVASIAKQQEEIFLPDKAEPVILPRDSQALFLMQRIRDEAHRFAVSYHTGVRRRAAFASQLEQVSGIGPKRRKALIRQFGSVRGIREASVDELASVPGMTRLLAERVKETL